MNTMRVVVVLAVLASLAACEREERHFRAERLNTGPNASATRQSLNQPAMALGGYVKPPAANISMYDDNAYAVSEGKRLFRWYNCSGCHANGGGNMGPPLMDDKWIYGAEPEQIVGTILQGRPNGMPSFAGRMPEEQAWQIAAYVRSMSGQLRTDVAANRGDSLSSGPPESRRDKLEPKPVNDSPRQ